MPRFRDVEEAELLAIYAFLASLPPGETEATPSQPSGARNDAPHPPSSSNGFETEHAMFVRLGCAGCHGPEAPFHARLEAARGKPAEQLATWIRHPEALKPGTPMPTYARLLDEQQALRLAQWVSAGRP